MLANCAGLNLPGLMEAMMPGRIIVSIKPVRSIEWFFRTGGFGLFFHHGRDAIEAYLTTVMASLSVVHHL